LNESEKLKITLKEKCQAGVVEDSSEGWEKGRQVVYY
jgi:hypothetical protein